MERMGAEGTGGPGGAEWEAGSTARRGLASPSHVTYLQRHPPDLTSCAATGSGLGEWCGREALSGCCSPYSMRKGSVSVARQATGGRSSGPFRW